MNPAVDTYLKDGCGRCSRYQTPQCSAIVYQDILIALRQIILDTGLREDFKWSQPCYTYQEKNVVIIAALKDYVCLSFFKGSLLSDPAHVLVAPGPNVQAARLLKLTDATQVVDQEELIRQYLKEAIHIEQTGKTVAINTQSATIPDELTQEFLYNPEFQEAFYRLTPGRQRGYLLHFAQAKQAKTRLSRINKWKPMIMLGQGMHDAYHMKKK